jgi:hypothetical protein
MVEHNTWYPYYGKILLPDGKDFNMKMIPSLKRTVGFLYYGGNGQYTPLGTALFVAVREENQEFVYLITCKHVVKDCPANARLFVRLNRTDKKDVEYIPLGKAWVYHKNKAIDLAVIRYTPPDLPCDFEPVQADNVLLSDAALRDYITEGDPVAFIGLFKKVTGTHRNFPIYRYGHIAMVADEKIDGHFGAANYLLVECEAYPGNSGSPLYVGVQTPTKKNPSQLTVYILGIMSGVYVEEEILSPRGKQNVTQNSRISLAVPINFVREILYGNKLARERKKHIEAGKSPNDRPIPTPNVMRGTD